MRWRVAFVVATAALLAASSSLAAAGDKYVGETETGERVKLITNAQGAVIRGAITAITDCTGSFDDFRARIEFDRPLDRTDSERFRHEGAFFEKDDRFSGRYVYEVEGKRESDRVIAGTLTLKVTFRRDGEKYTTCRVRGLVYGAERRRES